MDPMTPHVPTPPPASRPWFKKKWVWAVGVIAVLAVAGAGSSSEKKPETQLGAIAADNKGIEAAKTDTGNILTEATPTTAAPTTVTTAKPTTTTTAPKPTTTTTEKVSSCEQVREALLTGTQSQIDVAMRRLMADKTADSTAREYADYYMNRDAPGSFASKDMREMDIGLIRMACS